MKRILLSILTIALVSTVALGATRAWFSDTETSEGNNFTAGTLDLAVDGNNGTNTVKFTVSNMKPGSQNIGIYRLKNIGSIDGKLNLQDFVVTSQENGCIEPENEALDSSCGNPGIGEGELQNLVSLHSLFVDNDCDGWVDAGEQIIYQGKVRDLAANYDINLPLPAGAEKCVAGQFNWWNNGADDNLGQGDSFTLDFKAVLTQ